MDRSLKILKFTLPETNIALENWPPQKGKCVSTIDFQGLWEGTPPKTNISPENGWLEHYFALRTVPFQRTF